MTGQQDVGDEMAPPRGPLPAGATLSDVSESQVLDLIGVGRRNRADVLIGPGDDAALIASAPYALATTDTMIRGVDWLDEWSAPEDVATKCLTQNLADIAAMGGTPRHLLVALFAEPNTSVSWVTRFSAALTEAAARYDVELIGGDLSGAPEGTLAVAATALGTIDGESAVTRSGARVGDTVAICGTLGHSAAGLMLLRDDRGSDDPELVRAHLAPHCPVLQGPLARAAGAGAMIDISDGLLRDLWRIARSSKVAIVLDGSALGEDVSRLEVVLSTNDARECVLTGGEEHSLVACFDSTQPLPKNWRAIGAIANDASVSVRLDGVEVPAAGWDHFGAAG